PELFVLTEPRAAVHDHLEALKAPGTPAIVLMAGFLAACGGASSREINTPGGSRGYVVECADPADCYEEAGRLCASGYRVVDSGTHTAPTAGDRIANGFGAMGANINGGQAPRNTTTKTEAVIECTGSPGE
ncbi:MAG: hypothetical protein Q8N51_01275, partial [Gammaproteobacteria bacterium]|nr:hypothetical protein [Gammaproteobacteria bacterium]